MNPAVNLSGAARIAIILALIFAAVLIIHLIAGSRKLEGRAAYVALCCLAVLCLSGGALLFLSEGSPDPVQIEGFEPFGPEDLSAAASLMEETVSLQYTDGVAEGRAGVAYFDLIFEDGSFDRMALSAEYAALNPDENGEYADWRQAVVVDAGGRIYNEERGEPAEGLETIPADALFAALRQLGGLDWASALGTVPEKLLLSSGPEEVAAGGAAWVFTGGELVPADGYEGSGGLFALIVYGSAGEQRIFLDI